MNKRWQCAAAVVVVAGLASCDPEPAVSTSGEPIEYADAFRIVRIGTDASAATRLSVHACAGLNNRRLGGSVFVQTDTGVDQALLDGAFLQDEQWLPELGLSGSETVGADEFLNECVADFDGCVRYSYESQQEILPAILTASAALGVPPLADESPVSCDNPTLDATREFADRDTQLLSTQYVYDNYLDQTSGLAMLNPGYNREAEDLANPELIEDMPVALVDFVFARKLFVVFMINGCIDDHPEKALLSSIVADSGWDTPIGVFGYNDSWLIGGYLYEAQSRCLDAANMGAIPTRTTNLSFFDTRRPNIESNDDLARIPVESVTYDPDKTYVTFVVGDGDNVRYIMSTRKEWMDQRLAICKDADPECPPLAWSISPHLPDIAPDVLQWYYTAARSTGADYFVLPPSGYQYAYPTSLNKDDQVVFARRTEQAGQVLGVRGVVHWEWLDSWRDATDDFLPNYAHADGQIRGIFPINVPYLAEAFPWWPDGQMTDVITGADGSKLAVFRPQSWRGVDGSDDFHLTPADMADKLGAFPRGTVTWVYMTSDGGLTLENSYFALVDLLPDHVQLVSTDAAAELAIAAE